MGRFLLSLLLLFGLGTSGCKILTWPYDYRNCLLEISDPAATIQLCSQTIQSGMLTPERLSVAYTSRGFAHAKAEKYDQAVQDLDEAIRINPKSYFAFVTRADFYHRKRELDRSIADYSEAIRLRPTFPETFNDRGIVYWDRGDKDRAIDDLNRAIQLRPKFAGAYNTRGSIFLLMGRYTDALSDFETAAGLSSIVARYDLIGYTFFYLSRFADSTDAMKIAVGRSPQNVNNYIWLYLAQARSAGLREAEIELLGNMNYLKVRTWQVAASDFFLGKIDEKTFLTTVEDPDPNLRAERLCVVTFYAAEFNLLHGNLVDALSKFRATVKDCKPNTVMSHAARTELKRLGAK